MEDAGHHKPDDEGSGKWKTMIELLELVLWIVVLMLLAFFVMTIGAFLWYEISDALLRQKCDRIEKERFYRETRVKWSALERAYRKLQKQKEEQRDLNDILERTFKLRQQVKQELEPENDEEQIEDEYTEESEAEEGII